MKKQKFKQCPFCGEEDFDLIGLKIHLEDGICEVYKKISIIR